MPRTRSVRLLGFGAMMFSEGRLVCLGGYRQYGVLKVGREGYEGYFYSW